MNEKVKEAIKGVYFFVLDVLFKETIVTKTIKRMIISILTLWALGVIVMEQGVVFPEWITFIIPWSMMMWCLDASVETIKKERIAQSIKFLVTIAMLIMWIK